MRRVMLTMWLIAVSFAGCDARVLATEKPPGQQVVTAEQAATVDVGQISQMSGPKSSSSGAVT